MNFLGSNFVGGKAVVPLGGDFAFFFSSACFTRIDFYLQFLKSNNQDEKSILRKCDVNYSTMYSYNQSLNSLRDSKGPEGLKLEENPRFGGDFFPLKELASTNVPFDAIWSGYFTTRQNLKSRIVEFGRFLAGVKNYLVSSLKLVQDEWEDYSFWIAELVNAIQEAEFVQIVLTHHDAITGTSL